MLIDICSDTAMCVCVGGGVVAGNSDTHY